MPVLALNTPSAALGVTFWDMRWFVPSQKNASMQASDKSASPAAPFPLRDTLLACLVAVLVLFPLLGHRPLTDWDEGIYAEISREMIAGSWLVPHWNGHPWFEKPPLEMWLTALAMHLFGLNAWAARLSSACAGVATVGLLHTWLRSRLGGRVAWFSTVILLSAFGFQHAARVGEMDVLLGLGCLLGVIGLAEVSEGEDKAWWLFWSGFAVAIMTKGAASVVLPLSLAVIAGSALLDRAPAGRPGLRWGAPFWMGFLAFLAVVLPWHLWMYAHFGWGFLKEYLGYQVVQRTVEGVQNHHTHAWFYLWVLLVSAPPFALLFPWAILAPFQRPSLRILRSFAVFAAVSLGLFTLARTRVPHYMAPSYPVYAAMTGALLGCWWEEFAGARSPTGVRRTVAAGAVTLYLLAAALTTPARRDLHSAHFAAGYTTLDNREAVMLLQQTLAQAKPIPGPLLVWLQGPAVPVTADAFYAQRLAQQVCLGTGNSTEPWDLYFHSPEPLEHALASRQPRLMLLETSLAPKLDGRYHIRPLAVGRRYELAIAETK